MGKIELKPCPFCGNSPYDGHKKDCYIERLARTFDDGDLTEAWNTRHEPKPTCDGCVDEYWGDNCEHCIRYHRLSDCYKKEEEQ